MTCREPRSDRALRAVGSWYEQSAAGRWRLRRLLRKLDPPPRPGGGPAGVREPRRPVLPTLSGAAARPWPGP